MRLMRSGKQWPGEKKQQQRFRIKKRTENIFTTRDAQA